MVKDRQSSRSRVTVIGNTSWGNTLGAVLSKQGVEVRLWTRSEAEAQELNRGRRGYCSTSCLEEALRGASLVIWVVPSQKLRENVAQARGYLTNSMLLMSAAKGLEVDSGKTMSQVMAEELSPPMRRHICILSGPNLAGEIAQGLPAASVIAGHDIALAEKARKLMESPRFAVSTSDDVIGVELGGALKNILALGAGMIDGLCMGDNAKGAFIAWGWAEVVSLGVTLGARAETFYGLSGLGDLVTTCASTLSRNHYVGCELAKGRCLGEISASMTNVAEGVTTTAAVHQLARRHRLRLPIINLIYGILFEGLPPSRVLSKFEGLVVGHRCTLG